MAAGVNGDWKQGPQGPQLKPAEEVTEKVFHYFEKICARDEESARRKNAPYYALRVVGQGAAGLVMQVRRWDTNEDFALKAVDLEGLGEAERNRALTEVHLLLSCDFFSIIKCYEDHVRTGPNGEPLFVLLIMDYANAGDLRQEIKSRIREDRPFREHEAGLLFLQILMAVHHVHNRNMIHRDIKSANIFLCCSGIIKLGDFGLSRKYDESVSENVGRTFCGTPYYVAPEIWNRHPYSKKADMFSLGVLLYELLTLRRPFHGERVQDVMEHVLSGQYTALPEGISDDMRFMVDDLLHPDPQQRPNTRQLLNRPICKLFLDGLVGIIQTQAAFETTRFHIKENIQQTRDSLHGNRLNVRALPSNSEADADPASAASLSQAPFGTLDKEHIFCEGTLRKLSSDGTWKRRFVCIYCRVPLELATTMTKFDMLLAVSRRSVTQQCIVTPVDEFEDVFPVPPKYSGSPDGFVFAIAFKSGVKRVTYQASTATDREIWMRKFQQAIGLDTDV